MTVITKQTSNVKLWSRSFIFAMLANALLFGAFEMLLPTLPLFVAHIGGDATQIGLVTGIFVFSAILIRPFAGVLATKMDKKYLLIIGIAICALSTGAYYLSSDIGMMIFVRVIHGFGFGLATTYFTTIAAENIPEDRLGEGVGYFGVGETMAMSVGPLMGVSILDNDHFGSLFMSCTAFILLALLTTIFISRKPNMAKELRTVEAPTTTVKLIEKRVLFPSILIFMTGISSGGIMSFTTLYAIDKGFENVAWFFFIVAIAGLLVRLVSGKMFDNLGPAYVLIPAGVISIAGLIVFIMAQNEMVFLLAGFLYGMGFGAIFPALQTVCLKLVEEHDHENAIGSFFNFYDLGIGGGAILLGMVAKAFSYEAVFYVAIITYVLYLLLYLVHATFVLQMKKKRELA